MRKRLRRTLGVLALAALLLLAGVVWVARQSWEGREQIVARRASAALGLEVGIAGGIELRLFPELQFEARNVSVANLPGRPSPHLAEVELLELEISYLGLLRGQFEIDALELERVRVWIESDPNAHVDAAAAATQTDETSESRDLRFGVERLEIRDLVLHYQPGDAGTLRTGKIETLTLETDGRRGPVQIASRGAFAGHQFDLTGDFGPLSDLFSPQAPYPIELTGKLLDASFKLRGTAAQPRQLQGLDLEISGELPNLAGLYAAFREPDPRIPETGSITFKGRLRRNKGPFAIEELHIGTRKRQPLGGTVTGSIRNLGEFREVELELKLAADNLNFLQPLVRRPLPALQSLDAKLTVSDQDGGLGVTGHVRLLLPDGLGQLELVGKHHDLHGLEGLDVTVRGEARDLTLLGTWLGVEQALPPLQPVTLRAQLRDEKRRIGIYELEASAGNPDGVWVKLKGSLRDVEKIEGVVLSAEFGAQNLNVLETYLKRPLPKIGPITGSTTLTDRDGSLGLEPIRLHGGRKELLSIDLRASIDDLREINEIEADAKLSARDLAVVGELLHEELEPIGPVEFSGIVRGSDEDLFASGKLQLDRTFLEIHGSGSFAPGTRPSVKATLSSPQIWLDDLWIEPEADEESKDSKPGADSAKAWWQGSEPIPFELLRSIDLDLKARAETLSGRKELVVHNAGVSVTLKDGKLEVPDLSATWAGGELEAELTIDASTPGTELSLTLDLENLDLTKIAAQLSEKTESSGSIDARVRVHSEGESLDGIRSSLEGRALAVMRDGSAAGKVAQRFTRNLIGLSFPSLDLGTQAPLVSCFLAFTQIDAGIVTVEELRIQGGNIEVSGSGSIDLKEEVYRLDLVPHSRRRGLVSVVPVVRVRGPLQDPSVSPVPRTIATSIFEGLVLNATRPLQALTSPFRRNSGREVRCKLPPLETQP